LERVVEWPAAAAAAAAGCLASGCGRGVRGWSVAGPWPAVAAAAGGGGLAIAAQHTSAAAAHSISDRYLV